MSGKARHLTITAIDDLPGYRWSIAWTDEGGEEWSEEIATDRDVVERVRDLILEGMP